MKNLLLPLPLAQELANYLVTRPYREVAEIIAALTNLPEAKEPVLFDEPEVNQDVE